MSEKISVSYLALGGYVTFVVISSLLVGLLPPLVNRPYCKPETLSLADFKLDNSEQISPMEPKIHHQEKRESKKTINQIFEEKQEKTRKLFEKQIKRDPVFKRLIGERLSPSRAELPICPEIQDPAPGVTYPWYDSRLPNATKAINYNIELLLSEPSFDVYDGFIEAKFDVTAPLNYLLFHAGEYDYATLLGITDKNNNIVPCSCQGLFPFLRNDYYIVKPQQPLQPQNGPYLASFVFLDEYREADSGIFKIIYGPKNNNQTMLVSKLQPIDARKVYPIFDEPKYKATYDVTLFTRADFSAVFNMPVKSSEPDPSVPGVTITKFETSPALPSYFVAYSSFRIADFGKVTGVTSKSGITINLWARKEYVVTEDFVSDPLKMAINIFDALDDILTFSGTNSAAKPKIINILTVPEYPFDAVAHWAFPIFLEDKILFSSKTASEHDLQNVGLLLAKIFAEFWFGNFITPEWWDELWVQEGFADYLKYRVVDQAYPNWNILNQFITEELIQTLIIDGYPSSHPIYKKITNPYEIEEYYDYIESSKTASILRMVENELSPSKIFNAFAAFLNANPWGIANITVFYNSLEMIGGSKMWKLSDFFDRWTLQPNYPTINVKIIGSAPSQSIQFVQSRALNSNYSIFAGDLLYPSPFNFTWFVPIDCSFGTGPLPSDFTREREFYLDKEEETFLLPQAQGGIPWAWVHCDRKFVGYFELVYTSENWDAIGTALKEQNPEFLAEDRANIIHNLFLNAFSERGNYFQARKVFDYLFTERSYLPWRTVFVHLNDFTSIMEYRQTFFTVAEYFSFMMRGIESDIDVWSPGGSHIDELLRETIIRMACRFQDNFCLDKANQLWVEALPVLITGDFKNSTIPPYVREVVYNYHIQNTYDIQDWDIILYDFDNILDQSEQRKLLESLTFSRLPWLLARIITGIGNDYVDKIDFFEIIRLLSVHPLGRELSWDYYRINYDLLIENYSLDDSRLGKMLIDITRTFESDLLFYDLLEFVFFEDTGATANARLVALEYVSTNIIWLFDKEEEIKKAFNIREIPEILKQKEPSFFKQLLKSSNKLLNQPIRKVTENVQEFKIKAREEFMKKLRESGENVFPLLKKSLMN